MPITAIRPRTTNESNNKIIPGSVVEYEQHGKPLLAAALSEKKSKWFLCNQQGGTLELAPDRLYLHPGSIPNTELSHAQIAKFLQDVSAEADELRGSLNLEELWSTLLGEVSETSVWNLTELAFVENTLVNHLATRRSLLDDKVFFKRKKLSFEPRPKDIVAELLEREKAEKEKELERQNLLEQIGKRLKGSSEALPRNVAILEQLAALGSQSKNHKEALEVLELAKERFNLNLNGKPDDQAFDLLVKCQHFSPDENLDLIRTGRSVGFSDRVLCEVERLLVSHEDKFSSARVDLTALEPVTIDDESTLDVDDALSVQTSADGYRLGIHITDVASLIEANSILEEVSMQRGTSVYCPDSYTPMLPRAISEELASLHQGQSRRAVSYFITLDKDFNILKREILLSKIIVKHRLSYDGVDKILYGEQASANSALEQQLLLLWEISSALETKRLFNAGYQFSRNEKFIKIAEDKSLSLIEQNMDTPSHRLVGELMILANETAALYAQDNNFALVFRKQESPDIDPATQGEHIIEGPAREYFQRSFLKRSETSVHPGTHYGLGVKAYCQITSPIRRALDLICQRQLTHYLVHKAPYYSPDQLYEVMLNVEGIVSEGLYIQRTRARYWLLKYLQQEKIKEIFGIIIKAEGNKPLVELDVIYIITPFYMRSDVAKEKSTRLGQKILLKIEQINPKREILRLQEITDAR